MTDGTTTAQLVRAANKVFKQSAPAVRISERRADVALLKLRAALQMGTPCILSWNSGAPGDHWVAAVGMLGGRFLIADAADNELVLSMSAEEVLERWRDGNYFEGVML